jgi:hypothetical protein
MRDNDNNDLEVRKQQILKELLRLTYDYVSPSLRDRDRTLLMFRLLEVWLEDEYPQLLQSFYVDHR